MQISSELISFAALCVAVITLMLNKNKESTKTISEIAKLGARIESIQNGVDDIRVELRSMRTKMENISQRVSACETADELLTARVDKLEKEVFEK